VEREDLWDPKSGGIKFTLIDKTKIKPGTILDGSEILNRVLAKDKKADYFFRETDFAPRGTRPGLTAAIPPGMLSQRLEVDRISGLYGLNPGDHFFLVATYPEESSDDGLGDVPFVGVLGKEMVKNARRRQSQAKEASMKIVVRNGLVISGVESRESSASRSSGPLVADGHNQGKKKEVDEVVIAIAPSEILPLNEALSLGAKISCHAASSHPDSPNDLIIPELEESQKQEPSAYEQLLGTAVPGDEAPFSAVEIIQGENREVKALPRADVMRKLKGGVPKDAQEGGK
jgi:hypothetical protein